MITQAIRTSALVESNVARGEALAESLLPRFLLQSDDQDGFGVEGAQA
jgi:hypothetical protein